MDLSSSNDNLISDHSVEESEILSTTGDGLLVFPPELCCHDNTKLLFEASKQGNTALVKKLIEQTDANHKDTFINKVDEEGKTPLYYAASRGHVPLSRYLIQEVSVNLTLRYNSTQDTILHILSRISEERDGVEEIVKLLSGANLVNSRNRYTQTPLHCAAEFAPNLIFDYLLDLKDEDIFVVDDYNETILHALVKSRSEGKNEFVKKLVSRGISIEARNKHKVTPFLIACAFGTRTMCDFLVTEMRVDINAVDFKNRTALHKLSFNKNNNIFEIVQLLISKGLSIEARDNHGLTPFLTACAFGTCTLCEYLILELRVDIHAVSYKNRSALHHLKWNKPENTVDIKQMLISRGVINY